MLRPTRKQVVAVVGGVGALILVAVLLVVFLPRGCGRQFSDASKTSGGECVGLVKNSSGLDSSITGVVDKILDENDYVARSSGAWVRVVLLTPLSGTENTTAMSIDQVRFSLQGAYTALLRANGSSDFGDPAQARIQLLLVNQGSAQDFDRKLVDAIPGMGDTEHPVVAVVGLGSSFAGTDATAAAISGEHIPMVGAIGSSTTLDARTMNGFYSVSPNNIDYTEALKSLLDRYRKQMGLKNALIVADRNNDPYTRTLKDAFTGLLGGYVHSDPLPFTGSTAQHLATADVFAPVVTNICNAVADPKENVNTIFYAGRVADFQNFAEDLKGRTCRSTPLAVLVGATGFQAAGKYVDTLNSGNITIVYASSADAPTWIAGGAGTPPGFAAFLSAYRKAGFTDDSLNDGYAIGYHDALVCAAQAIRLAAQSGTELRATDVDAQFGNLSHAYTVRSAAGTLTFGRADGHAVDKDVVYRQIGSATPIRLPAGLKPFLTRNSVT